ncbi:unnamed protein product [Pleuronectes platessa]|uniref:Uncharacterized protein n=1 Tax=Pleuronectes platessa TaxID=8262 RepID=A0A9N7YT93_PLEPL|nr:unnamed protein product [Pleuronectes platessa]
MGERREPQAMWAVQTKPPSEENGNSRQGAPLRGEWEAQRSPCPTNSCCRQQGPPAANDGVRGVQWCCDGRCRQRNVEEPSARMMGQKHGGVWWRPCKGEVCARWQKEVVKWIVAARKES